jgi:hypothetical protein
MMSRLVGSILISATSVTSTALLHSEARASEQTFRNLVTVVPVFPFSESGLCIQDCPSLGSRAVVDYLSISIVGQAALPSPRATLRAGDTIMSIFLGLDNNGYSNWWEAKATLISDTNGQRVDLGRAMADDGNDFKSIRISCDRDFNRCSPFMSWQMIRTDSSLPAGLYSLEVGFTPFAGSGLPAVTHVFGPGVFMVNPGVPRTGNGSTKGIGGRPCPKLGRTRVDKGTKYACVKDSGGRVWKRLA